MNDLELHVLKNQWSEAKTPDNTTSGISFIDPSNSKYTDYIKGFVESLKNQEVPCLDVYCPVPYTYGKSYFIDPSKDLSFLFILDSTENYEAICELCEYSRNNDGKLIGTNQYKHDKDKTKIEQLIQHVESLLSDEYKDDYSESFVNFQKNGVILLWICIKDIPENEGVIYELIDRFNSSFDERISLNSKDSGLNLNLLNELFFI